MRASLLLLLLIGCAPKAPSLVVVEVTKTNAKAETKEVIRISVPVGKPDSAGIVSYLSGALGIATQGIGFYGLVEATGN